MIDRIILDLCGGTGAWSKPYRDAGYDVHVITLPGYDVKHFHFFGDVYGILAAPPCGMFSSARLTPAKPRDLRSAMEVVAACQRIIWEAQYDLEKDTGKKTRLKFWALENSNGLLKYFLGKPALQFHPYEYGNPYKKLTNVWGWFKEPKKNAVEPDKVNISKLGISALKKYHGDIPKGYKLPAVRRDKILRAITPSGFAQAFFEANP